MVLFKIGFKQKCYIKILQILSQNLYNRLICLVICHIFDEGYTLRDIRGLKKDKLRLPIC